MENRLGVDGFDAGSFVLDHHDSYVVFVTGGWDFTTREAYYKCLLCYGFYKKKIEREFECLRSPNVAMLHGVIDACSLLKKRGTKLFLVSPTALGFKKGAKGKGVNADLVQKVLQICEQKNIELHDVCIEGGGRLLRDVINEKVFL